MTTTPYDEQILQHDEEVRQRPMKQVTTQDVWVGGALRAKREAYLQALSDLQPLLDAYQKLEEETASVERQLYQDRGMDGSSLDYLSYRLRGVLDGVKEAKGRGV